MEKEAGNTARLGLGGQEATEARRERCSRGDAGGEQRVQVAGPKYVARWRLVRLNSDTSTRVSGEVAVNAMVMGWMRLCIARSRLPQRRGERQYARAAMKQPIATMTKPHQ
jgi:hypothetical protein